VCVALGGGHFERFSVIGQAIREGKLLIVTCFVDVLCELWVEWYMVKVIIVLWMCCLSCG